MRQKREANPGISNLETLEDIFMLGKMAVDQSFSFHAHGGKRPDFMGHFSPFFVASMGVIS